jgi:molybdopterin molybdotransferase
MDDAPRPPMIPVAEAQRQIFSGVAKLVSEDVSVADAFGRVLAADVASRMTQPPVAVSAMDGYAVRAEDVAKVPAILEMIGESSAGKGFGGAVGKGQTIRIFTGAPVPDGADAIVIQEDTAAQGSRITMKEAPAKGHYVRPAGLDFAKGQVLLKVGKRLNSRDVALIAGMNVPWVKVTRKPRVAILSTGNELVMPGDAMGAHQIISSNSLGLAAFVNAAGGLAVNLGIALDTPDALREKLAGIRGMDLLVTIGGASVGDYDLVKQVAGGEGLDITFSQVAMRPGKPLIFGTIHGVPMLGLPGNPVSAGVCAALYMKPMIDILLGAKTAENAGVVTETAVLGRDLGENDRRQDYLRSKLELSASGELTATPFAKQDSSMLATFAQADCLVVRAPHAPAIKAGARVPFIRLDPGA